jgi:hypothetical protein
MDGAHKLGETRPGCFDRPPSNIILPGSMEHSQSSWDINGQKLIKPTGHPTLAAALSGQTWGRVVGIKTVRKCFVCLRDPHYRCL